MPFPVFIALVIAAAFVPALAMAIARSWLMFALFFVASVAGLSYVAYTLLDSHLPDGPAQGLYPLGMTIAWTWEVVAWFAFLVAAASRAYRIAVPRSRTRR